MRNFKDIHKFHLNDKYIILDVNSGAVHEVDEIVYSMVDDKDNKNYKLMLDNYNNFPREDVLTALEEIDLLEKEGLLYSQRQDYPFPLHSQGIVKALCLHIAHDCNLKCKYCFASQGNFKGQRSFMSPEVGKKALDFLVENSGNIKNLEVDFFGGEPLMNFDAVKEITLYGRELEKTTGKVFRFTLTTNALLLNDKISDFLNEHMSNVVLSLDGRKEVNDKMRLTLNNQGSYDLITNKIQKFLKERGNKDYYVRGTFTSENLDFGKDVAHFKDLGFKSVSMEPVVTDPEESYAIRDEHLSKVLKEYEDFSKEYINIKKEDPNFSFFHFEIDLDNGPCVIKRASGCGAGSEYLAITPEGDLYPCHQFVGEEGFSMGNVFDGITNKDLRKSFQDVNVYSKEECKDCWARYYCSGGCHANSYHANNGDFTKVYELGCQMGKKRIEAAMSILANLRGD